MKTPGGHRRFARREVERFRDAHGGQADDDVFRLLQLLLHDGSTYAMQSSLVEMRGRLGSWWQVADVVAGSLKELGDHWQQGSCSIAQEHHATRRLQQAIWACGEALPSPPPEPRCILAAVEREEHTLGLSLGELCLREAGWACLWLGSPTPTSVLLEAIQQFTPNMVVVSASAFASNSDFLDQQCRSIYDEVRCCGAPLILAGDGAWPDDCRKRIRSFEEFAGVLAR